MREPANRPPAECAICGDTWTGEDPAHCAKCHRTFATAADFEAHEWRHLCKMEPTSRWISSTDGSGTTMWRVDA